MPATHTEPKIKGYRLGEELGSGAMGAVYIARRESNGAPVAVKIIHPEHLHDPRLVARFMSEARAITQIEHENVIKVFECVQTEDGHHALVMELICGESLRNLLDRVGCMPIDRAVEIAASIALGIAAAHEKGIVHRDLKPDNVMISDAAPGEDEQVKVLDFGVAKIAGDRHPRVTMTGTIVGTPDYMAPEMISNPGEVAPTADIYSLGCVLFQMCTGVTPFSARGYEVLVRQVHDAPPSPSALNSAVPSWLEAIILRALSKDPAHRFQSMTELASALMERNGTPVRSTKRGRAALAQKLSTAPGRPVLDTIVCAPPEFLPLDDLHSAPTQIRDLHALPTRLKAPAPLAAPRRSAKPHVTTLAQAAVAAPTRRGGSSPTKLPTIEPTEYVRPIGPARTASTRRSAAPRTRWLAAAIVAIVLGSMGLGRALQRVTPRIVESEPAVIKVVPAKATVALVPTVELLPITDLPPGAAIPAHVARRTVARRSASATQGRADRGAQAAEVELHKDAKNGLLEVTF